MTVTVGSPIDPFRICEAGRYADEVVVVDPITDPPPGAVRTGHFAVYSIGTRLHVWHGLRPDRIDNDVAGLLATELFAPGWLTGEDCFERVLTGIVLTSAADPEAAWELFYRNTLARLARPTDGTTATFAPIYAHARSLLAGDSVLELGCCFGFLSLQLPGRVTASDVIANTVGLLARMTVRLDRRIDTLVCDAARVPRPDRSADTVLAVHLLEHLEPGHGEAVVAEMLRLARRRAVIAVPFEDEPTAAYGHVRVFTPDDLRALGAVPGWRARSYAFNGGWLILDRV
jgi:hypothetical protein